MTLDIDLVSDAFYVESEPDIWKARNWVQEMCKVRIIPTVAGAYGALDQSFGTTYFDVGDWLLKVGIFRQVVVLSGDIIQSIEETEENDDNE